MKIFKFILFLTVSTCIFSCTLKKRIAADIFVKNGIVFNGIDTIPMKVSIAIKDDRIVFIGDPSLQKIKSRKIIDAKGLIVSPGFIDPHTHADRELVDKSTSHNLPFLTQGITTLVVGNDGESFFPSKKYKDLYAKNGIGTNVVLLTGQGTIRSQIIGESDKAASANDIIKMKTLMQQEMDAGSFGMSTGLFYSPGSYATTAEVIELAKTAAKNGGVYDTHLRDESSYSVGLLSAIEEAIEIGRQAKLPIHISHIKCLGVDVWHQSTSIIKLIENARKEGIDVTADQYPYDASATGLLAAVVPRWAESGGIDSLFIRYKQPQLKNKILEETKQNIIRRGGPDRLLIVKSDDSSFVGKNLLEISKMLDSSPEEAVYKALETGFIRVASFNMNSDDIINFMKQPWVVTGSDGNTGHPRKYGSFPRKYSKYVLQEKVLDIGSFINGSTSRTAAIFKIPNRGVLKEGNYADVIIFNPKTFRDKADYNDAFQFSEGLEYSIINGQLAIEKGKFTAQLNGRVLSK